MKKGLIQELQQKKNKKKSEVAYLLFTRFTIFYRHFNLLSTLYFYVSIDFHGNYSSFVVVL